MARNGKNSSNYPRFFRVMLPHNLQNGSTLELPTSFVRKHGECLHKYCSLKLPTGSEYQMKVEKMRNNRAWLHKGWPDFVDKYSIQTGYFLVFKYEGRSLFRVRIFDMTASETDYYPPLTNIAIPDSYQNAAISNQIEKAKPLKCNESSFTVVMRQTYVNLHYVLYIPNAHSWRYLRDQHGQQAFLVVQKTTWAVIIYVGNIKTGTRFTSGWKDFVEDNSLEEGDSCVFEILNHIPNYYKVSISRVAKSP